MLSDAGVDAMADGRSIAVGLGLPAEGRGLYGDSDRPAAAGSVKRPSSYHRQAVDAFTAVRNATCCA